MPTKKKTLRKRKTAAPKFLEELEDAFEASVILYATSTRVPTNLFGAQIASDVLPVLGEHLDTIGNVKRIGLVLHTHGGALETPWPFVNLLRQHAEELFVIVPEIALSAGTLIALGADKIVMGPHAFLSPVDPTSSWHIEGQQRNYSIEDVIGYVEFVTDRVGIRDQTALVEALKQLTQEVKASVLGNIHRTCSLIERLGKNLLRLHMTKQKNEEQIAKIVDFLTHSLFTHNHLIPLNEARDVIGFSSMIVSPDEAQIAVMKKTHSYILRELKCREPFDPQSILSGGKKDEHRTVAKRAIVRSLKDYHVFSSTYEIAKTSDGQIQVKPFGIPAWKKV